MRRLYYLSLLPALAVMLSSCISNTSTAVPTTSTKTSLPSPAPVLQTSTPLPEPTQTATLRPPATLDPEQATETIAAMLRGLEDCPVPCFFGIVPSKTTVGEAKNDFSHLGLQVWHNLQDNKEFYGADDKMASGLSISVSLTIENVIVKNIAVGINTEPYHAGVSRQWSAFSPESLISRYGPPSRVDLFLGRVDPTPTHAMVLYFDAVNLIVEYTGTKLLSDGPGLEICPLTNDVDFLRVWMGSDPQYPPTVGVPLEKATSLTLGQFSKLMTGRPDQACFKLNEAAFP